MRHRAFLVPPPSMVWLPTHIIGGLKIAESIGVSMCILSPYIHVYIYMYKYYIINPSCPEESLKMTPAFRLVLGFPVKQWKEGILESPKIRPYVHSGGNFHVIPNLTQLLVDQFWWFFALGRCRSCIPPSWDP